MPKNPDLLDYMRSYEFWREACTTLVSHVCEILALAEMEVTPETIIRFVRDIGLFVNGLTADKWPDCFCDTCFRAAFELTKGKESHERCEELMRYFGNYLGDRTWAARTMLCDSVIGIISCFEHLTPK